MSARRHWLLRARVALYVLVVVAVGGLVWRFDVVGLPSEGCSPLFDLDPGDRLLVDVRPPKIARDDAVLFQEPGAAGELLLGRVGDAPADVSPAQASALAAGALWIVHERPECPGRDSRTFGPLPADAVAGRVVMVLP